MKPTPLGPYAMVRATRELVTAGKVKTVTEIVRALKVKRRTLYDVLERFGVTPDNILKPDKWPATLEESEASGGGEGFINGVQITKVIGLLKQRPMTLDELSATLDRGKPTIETVVSRLMEAGYDIEREEQHILLPKYVAPRRSSVLSDEKAKHIKFAVASDWHIGSKAAQVSALRAFLDVAVEKHEARHILVPGDVTAGFGVYRGQANEVYAQGSTEQLDALVNTLPQYPGVTYYIMGGNHDYSFMKSSGFNIVKSACKLRNDWVYLGFDEAVVPLTEELDIVLWHPSGGVPYALTYRGQKFAAELAQRELVEIITGKKERPKTRFIFWGHLHVAASFPHGPIRVIGPGCFEGRNSYLKQKGLTPKIQGVVVEVYLTDDNLIQRHVAHEYEYLEIDEDWRNAYVPSVATRESETVVPMFKWKAGKGKRR